MPELNPIKLKPKLGEEPAVSKSEPDEKSKDYKAELDLRAEENVALKPSQEFEPAEATPESLPTEGLTDFLEAQADVVQTGFTDEPSPGQSEPKSGGELAEKSAPTNAPANEPVAKHGWINAAQEKIAQTAEIKGAQNMLDTFRKPPTPFDKLEKLTPKGTRDK